MYILIIEQHSNTEVTVTINHTIRVGGHYRINPSYGYAGIESGVVTVLAIVEPTGFVDLPDDVDSEQLASQINEHIRIEVDMGTDEYELMHQPWVVYRYGTRYEWECLPIDLFVGHMSQWV